MHTYKPLTQLALYFSLILLTLNLILLTLMGFVAIPALVWYVITTQNPEPVIKALLLVWVFVGAYSGTSTLRQIIRIWRRAR